MTSRSLTLVAQPGHQLTSASVRYARPSPVQALERDPDGARAALVHRVAQPAPVTAAAEPPLLGEDHLTGRGDELAHPLEVAIATQRGAALALLREDPVEHELRGDARVVEAREEERRAADHARVADHQVLDRRALGVAEVERARHVRRRLDEDERRQAPVGGRAGPVRARRRPPPASARTRRARTPPACMPWAAPAGSSLRRLPKRNDPLVQRTNGVVVPPAGSGAGDLSRTSRVPGPASLAARYRAPTARLASDLRVRRVPRGSHRPALAPGSSGPTPLGRRREAGSVHREPRALRPSNRRRRPGRPGMNGSGIPFHLHGDRTLPARPPWRMCARGRRARRGYRYCRGRIVAARARWRSDVDPPCAPSGRTACAGPAGRE